MLKIKAIIIAVTLIILGFYISIMNHNFAVQNSFAETETQDWKVKITNDTKDLKETHQINFEVVNNSNVVDCKIAPGVKSIATLEIDLTGTKVPVDISYEINDKNMLNFLKLTTKIDDDITDEKTVALPKNGEFSQKNGKKKITLELEWTNDEQNNMIDTKLGQMGEKIEIPITINVKQHI